MSLEKIVRLAGGDPGGAAPDASDDIRVLVQAASAALTEACETGDPAQAAELVLAAQDAVAELAQQLYIAGMPDWVEATSAPLDGSMQTGIALAGSKTPDKPYGDVEYADPGYNGKKRYPIDEKHVKAAWSYINQAKNAAKYTASQLSSIKTKIKGAMKKYGHGVNVTASATDAPVLGQLASGEAWVMLAAPSQPGGDIAMRHAPFTGTHAHAHRVTMTHMHEHSHMNDSEHGGMMHGRNTHQKAYAAKGEADGRGRDYMMER